MKLDNPVMPAPEPACPEGALMRAVPGLCYRSGLNAARISVANSSGSSQAAK